MGELLTAEELADRLRVKPTTVKTWARDGLIPVCRLTPKVVRFNFEAVVKAMTDRQESTR